MKGRDGGADDPGGRRAGISCLGVGGGGGHRHPLTAPFLVAGVVSVAAWLGLGRWAPPATVRWSEPMEEAARQMARGLRAAAEHCRERGLEVEPALDPHGTCLVGPSITELFTTQGDPAAKRTTLNPDLAGLMVHLLELAGVGPGDAVAVGASGSFPALLLASLTAAEALGAHPRVILSLGASSYGATRPEFHLLAFHRLLLERGIVAAPPVALSLGGRGDVGADFDPAFRERLLGELAGEGLELLVEEDLRANVARRLALYGVAGKGAEDPLGEQQASPTAGGRTPPGRSPPKVFVNIGGSEANLGTSPLVLRLPPGWVGGGEPTLELPPPPQRGVIWEMLARGVPVIHLLHIRGLALRYGLPWDPDPLPEPGTTRLRSGERTGGVRIWLLTVVYGVALGLVGAWGWRRVRREGKTKGPGRGIWGGLGGEAAGL